MKTFFGFIRFCPGLLILLFSSGYATSQPRLTGWPFDTRSVVMARHGMACTSNPLATMAAIGILGRGGTAVDAAIAANAVLGVTDPEMNGIGGDLFAIVYDARTHHLYGLNGSGHSPYGLTLEMLLQKGLKQIPVRGALPVSVPGCVDGWFTLHGRFGKLPMKEVLQPAIQYAREGIPLEDEAAYYWKDLEKKFSTYPNIAAVYLPNGKAPGWGELFRNPQLANTLQKIASEGKEVFYQGEIARRIVSFIQKEGGYLSLKDLEDHHSEWVDPVSTTYRGYRVWELPPNSQGIAVLQMLNLLEGFDFTHIPFGSPEHIHLFVEAKKLAYEDRAKYYADMDFAKVPVRELISKAYADQRRQLISMDTASTNDQAGSDSLLNAGETVYLTVADDSGNMVSLIQSNFQEWGSAMVPDSLGFVLQDRGQLFSLKPGQNNTYAPHKRPFHTIIPAFVTRNDQPFMSFGVMGGGFQPLGQVQVLMNIIDFGMNIQQAGDAPRIDHQGSSEPTGQPRRGGGEIFLEPGFPFTTVRALIQMGHRVGYEPPGNFGGYQCIRVDPVNKIYYGASDPRKDGMAAGF